MKIQNSAAFEFLAALPLATYRAGETVLKAGSKTGRLLFLKRGEVAVFKDSIEIVRVNEPGAVFGEISALLDQPHSADVRVLKNRSFMSPTQRSSGKTRLRCFTSQRFWRGVLSLLTRVL